MASYTTNLNLKKPAGSENVAIGDINGNMDTIDTAYGSLNSNIQKLTTTGYTNVMETLATSGQNISYTIQATGLYAVRASNASNAGDLNAYMFTNSNVMITNVLSTNVDAWGQVYTPPIPLIAGTTIKAQFIGPTGASGAIIKYEL